jgi:hypothetical protein
MGWKIMRRWRNGKRETELPRKFMPFGRGYTQHHNGNSVRFSSLVLLAVSSLSTQNGAWSLSQFLVHLSGPDLIKEREVLRSCV